MISRRSTHPIAAAVLCAFAAGALVVASLATPRRIDSQPARLEVPEPLRPPLQAWADAIAAEYGLAIAHIYPIVDGAARAARVNDIELSLLLAVIAVESRFNVGARSADGAVGLMQIMPRFHAARFDQGDRSADPADWRSNIEVGTEILREYADRCGGDRVCALQRYNGHSNDPSARYAVNVASTEAGLLAALERTTRAEGATRVTPQATRR